MVGYLNKIVTYMDVYIKKLEDLFTQNADIENAEKMSKYLRNLHPFFGIKSPDRKELLKIFIKENGLPEEKQLEKIVKELYALPQREYHYTAIGILEKRIRKTKEEDIYLYEYLITHQSWWDTVDYIFNKLLAPHFKKYPEQIKPITGKWIASDNIWLQRSAILFQLHYKTQTDTDLLFDYIKKTCHSKEFFIQKAIGWALREYSKTDAQTVIDYIDHNKNDLAPLSIREGLKWLNNRKT